MECLEIGVSKWPKAEGRFPQVSGIIFSFDANKPSGERVDRKSVKIGDEHIFLGSGECRGEKSPTYRMATKSYLAKGKDGYTCLPNAKVLIAEENGPLLRFAVQNHFNALDMRKGMTKRCSVHHQSLVTMSRR